MAYRIQSAIRIDRAGPSGTISAMFLAVTAGYLVAALFAFCGIVSTCLFLTDIPPGTGPLEFVNSLVMASRPLAVASGVYLLTHLAMLLQRQNIVMTGMLQPAPPRTSSARAASERPVRQQATANHPPVTAQAPAARPAVGKQAQKPADNTNPEAMNFFRVD